MFPNIPSRSDLRKIVVLNPKGGSGKSTIATNLAGFLAASGQSVTLMDFDSQGSSMRWLQNRPQERPMVDGIAAYQKDLSMTRSWQLRVPDRARYLVIDTPAALRAQDLADFTRGVHAILVPVLPSDIDIHAATKLISDMLLVAKVSRRMGRLGVIANRVRANTVAYRRLMLFLDRLSIEIIGELRDSQNYVHAASDGLCIQEMAPSKVLKDLRTWNPITEWLEQRLKTPVAQQEVVGGEPASAMHAPEPAGMQSPDSKAAPPATTAEPVTGAFANSETD